jgi:hypothetical protein
MNRRPVSLSGSNIRLRNAHFYNTTQQRRSADRIAVKHAKFNQSHSSCNVRLYAHGTQFFFNKGEDSGIYCFCVGHKTRDLSALHLNY